LPAGGRILEAGSGGGWLSLALAETGRFDVTLLDYSEQALEYSRRVFAKSGQPAEFLLGSIETAGTPDFDLVFNAGVLEHYSVDQQASLLASMGSRSRAYVLALVPNAACYWYWVWRTWRASEGRWDFGREVPEYSLGEAFRRSGLTFEGERFLGADWVESFVDQLPGLDDDLRSILKRIHRSGVVSAAQSSYLVASLGRHASAPPSSGWLPALEPAHSVPPMVQSALADALAGGLALESNLPRIARDQEAIARLAETRLQDGFLLLRDQVSAIQTGLEAFRQEARAPQQSAVDRDRLTSRVVDSLSRQTLEALTAARNVGLGAVQEVGSRLDQIRADWAAALEAREAMSALLQSERAAFAAEREAWGLQIARLDQERQSIAAELAAALEQFTHWKLSEKEGFSARLRDAEEHATARFRLLERQVAGLEREVASLESARASVAEQASQHLATLAAQTTLLRESQSALAAFQTRADSVEMERSQLGSELARLRTELETTRAELETAAQTHSEVRQNADASSRRADQLEKEADEARQAAGRAKAELGHLGYQFRALEQWRHEAEQALRTADQIRTDALNAVSTFEHSFIDVLRTYRSQRAWQTMLLLRKAYTLAFRQGLEGKLRLLTLPFDGQPLEDFELTFPSIRALLPDLKQPIQIAPPAAAQLPEPTPAPAAPPVEVIRAAIPDEPVAETCVAGPALHAWVILPIFEFEFRYQRPQQLAAGFARQGHRVFWISPGRVLPPDSDRLYELVPLQPNLWEVRLRWNPFDLYRGELDPRRLFDLSVALNALYRDAGVAESAVQVQFPSWGPVAFMLREQFGARVAYDCMDDWRNWPTEPKPGPFSLHWEARLTTESDALIVTSKEFVHRFQDNVVPPVFVPNGADFDFFSDPGVKPKAGLGSGKIVAYYGAISRWFNVEMLTEVVKNLPECTFILIGAVHDRDVSGLQALPNVRFLGEKDYRELPAYLRAFDVCLIPFKLDELTKAVDPVKAYEYLSQGKPVVATRMQELARFGDLLYYGDTAEEYTAAIREALTEEDPELVERRLRFARENGWDARCLAINEAMRETFPLVSILVVTYNSIEFLPAFLDSVANYTTYPNYELVVVDNASKDASVKYLNDRAQSDSRIRVIASKTNHGFAGGNNLAARESKGEYLCLLNPDTVVTPGWVERLLLPFQGGGIGMTAPVTNYSGNETRIATTYQNQGEMLRFASDLSRRKFLQTKGIDVIPLLCGMLPRPVWEASGGLDERYQVGLFEDDDLSIKIRELGFRLVTVEDCFIHHFGHGSFAQLDPEKSNAVFEANRRRFEEKWGRAWEAHQSRPDAPPLTEVKRIPVPQFVRDEGSERRGSKFAPPELLELHPAAVVVGQAANGQPDGRSALVVSCTSATPQTVIEFDGEILNTSFGSAALLSAILPEGFNRSPAKFRVRLISGLGESDSLEFSVV
jgi:GT2 family glycosyltransferase/glycosyltransferase involved in cell wall biosynthesis/SAM-dependent methyltransferase/uncharacterized coiled-coil DUF342 family protein